MTGEQALYFNALLKKLHQNKPGMSIQGLIYISFILANYEIGKTRLLYTYELTAEEYGTTPAACERAVRRWITAIDETTLAEFLNLETITDWRTTTIIPLLKATIG
jgi:hypothetical protein